MGSQIVAPACYATETSGWDVDENFFVEKTDFEWGTTEKRIHLQHSVRPGAVIFIRLLGESPLGDSCPVAHEALKVTYQPRLGSYEVQLTQLLPRKHGRQQVNSESH